MGHHDLKNPKVGGGRLGNWGQWSGLRVPWKGLHTCPEMQPIKAVGIEIIANPVAAPALAAPWVGAVALSEGPAHP